MVKVKEHSRGVGKTKELLIGYHKVKGLYPLNDFNSRFAYALYVDGKRIPGEWELDSANVSKGTYTYKRLK